MSGRSRACARAVLLTGLGAGLWLLGQGSASADEAVAPALVPDVSSVVADVVPPVVEGVGTLPTPTPTPTPTSAPAGKPAPAAEAAAPADVGPLLREVAAAAVESSVEIVSGVASDVPVIGALDPTPVLEPQTRLPQEPVPSIPAESADGVQAVGSPETAAVREVVPTAPEGGSSARPPALVDRPFAGLLAPDPAAPTAPPTSPSLPALPVETPSTVVCSGASPSDQAAADLSAIVPGASALAGVPAGDDDHAVGTLAFDPSFSPD
jgi:hypothetical protein